MHEQKSEVLYKKVALISMHKWEQHVHWMQTIY